MRWRRRKAGGPERSESVAPSPRLRRWFDVLSLLIVLVAVSAACGAADEQTTAPTTSSDSTSASSSTDPLPTSEPQPESDGSGPENNKSAPEKSANDQALAELNAARQRWTAAAIGDHTLTVQNDCGECGPDHSATAEVVMWNGEAYGSHPEITVETMFDQAETAIRSGEDVDITYHPDTGHPTELWIDREAAAVDGGTHLIIHDLQAGLPGDEVSTSSFERARRLWTTQAPAAYEYTVLFACGGCAYEGRLLAHVVNGQVTDERFEPRSSNTSATAITIDAIFADLADLFGAGDGLRIDGVVIAGTAEYDPDFGYPNWIGLDFNVVDPSDAPDDLPPRLVYMITDFRPLTEGTVAEAAKTDDYCVALDLLFSSDPRQASANAPDAVYLARFNEMRSLAPPAHLETWDLFATLYSEPFSYERFNPAADALDDIGSDIDQRCPLHGRWALDDSGYLTYR